MMGNHGVINADGSRSKYTHEWEERCYPSGKGYIKKINERFLESNDQYVCTCIVGKLLKMTCTNILKSKNKPELKNKWSDDNIQKWLSKK